MEFLDDLSKLCIDLDRCQIMNCEKVHPRCLRGICIGYLKGICQQKDFCGLLHYSYQELEVEFDKQPINGFYQHNLCIKKCKDVNCNFLHPPWLYNICDDCKNKKCDKKKEGLWHIYRWQDIKTKVYQKYHINQMNPEKLCIEVNCQCEAHKYNFDQYCINYFKGICPYHRCQKIHKLWEDLKDIADFQNQQNQKIEPCIKFNQEQNKFVSYEQTQSNVFMQKNQLKLMVDQVQKRPQVDIIFVLDCTISMRSWIEAAKKSISLIISEFKKKVQINTAIRMAAVCYKDFSEGPNHIKFHNFTVRPDEIEKFISSIKVEGGDDIPEDLQGALDVALKLNICKDPESLLQLFIITDAPCHGKKYHNFVIDSYPNCVNLEEKLQKFVDLKQRFFLSFLQIQEQTLIMEKAMQKVVQNNYQSAKIADKQFSDYILFSLASTYNKSLSINTHKDFQHVCYAQYTKQKDMPYKFNNRDNYKYSDVIEQQILQTKKTGQTLLFIQQEELLVNQKGQSVEVFKGFDQKNNVYVVIKIPKYIINKFVTNKLTEQDIEMAKTATRTKYVQQLIAKQLSHHFNFCCNQRKLSYVPFYYATPYLYELEKPFKGLKLIYAESYIDIDDPWKKYTNNSQFRDQSINLTAFSHFSYDYTNGQLIITDLQGINNILSDPAIHSLDSSLIDSTNLSNEGCSRFFVNQHPVCQKICTQLGLQPTVLQQQIQITTQNSEQSTEVDEFFASNINKENLYKICSNCNNLEKLVENSNTIELCQQCQKLKSNTEVQSCQCCQLKFEISYNYEQLFGTTVQYCMECQNKSCHLVANQKCYYCEKKICLQTIKEINIKNNKIPICIDAFLFLRQIKCKNCNSKYNFNILLSQEDYYGNNYNCGCNYQNI